MSDAVTALEAAGASVGSTTLFLLAQKYKGPKGLADEIFAIAHDPGTPPSVKLKIATQTLNALLKFEAQQTQAGVASDVKGFMLAVADALVSDDRHVRIQLSQQLRIAIAAPGGDP